MERLCIYSLLFSIITKQLACQPISTTCADAPLNTYPYCNASLPIPDRVNDLLSRMTLMEKVVMQNSDQTGIPRLGVLPLGHSECNRGASVYPGYNNASWPTSTFAQAINLGGAFDRNLESKMARAISNTVRAKYNKALNTPGTYNTNGFGLACWGPMINICRDPRWGRCQEGYGEDPMLQAEMAIAYIPSLQHDPEQPEYLESLSTTKHFDLQNGPENGRGGFDTIENYRDWRETFLPHFEAAVKAGTSSLMCSYNAINGIPSCANSELLQDVLRNEFGFTGYVTSDCGAVPNIYSAQKFARNIEEAAEMAIKAGCDWIGSCNGPKSMFLDLYQSITQETCPEIYLDKALKNVLPFWFKLGLIDKPMNGPWKNLNLTDVYYEYIPLAFETAYKSMVLLKNENNYLPINFTDKINNKIKKYAFIIIGPCANNTDCYSGDYQGNPIEYISPIKSLSQQIGEGNYIYFPGCTDASCDKQINWNGITNAVAQSDNIIFIGGDSIKQGAEGHDRSQIELPDNQSKLFKQVYNAIIDHNSQHLMTVLTYGAPVIDQFMFNNSISILGAGYAGEQTGPAITALLNGSIVPSGKLTTTWFHNTSELASIDNYNMSYGLGRTYRYYNGVPIWSFGYGLSYTVFNYSNLKLSKTNIKPCDDIIVSFNVRNNGNIYIADESSQVYLRIMNRTYVTDNIRLVNFTRNENIKPKQNVNIELIISYQWMGVIQPYNYDKIIIPGQYQVMVGGILELDEKRTYPGLLKQTFTISGPPTSIKSC
eukprot:468127_1